MKCLRRRVVLKGNFHLKGSECIRAEFAVVSCSVALEQCNCARTYKDLAQDMSLLEQKGGGKQKGAEFSKVFQGFCLRL